MGYKRDIAVTTEEEKRIIFKACSQVMETYWEKLFELRIEQEKWSEISPFGDAFEKRRGETDEASKDPKYAYVTFASLIPACRPYWDMVMGLYVLLKPQVYLSLQVVAFFMYKEIMRCGDILKLDPTQFQNFSEIQLGYIKCLAEGERESTFVHPFLCIRDFYRDIKEVKIADIPLSAENRDKRIEVLEEEYSKLSIALEQREQEFQDRCLRASVPTSPSPA